MAWYFDAGGALREIRDRELYKRRGNRTFAAYLRRWWRMGNDEAEWIMNVSAGSQRMLAVARAADTGKPPLHVVRNDHD